MRVHASACQNKVFSLPACENMKTMRRVLTGNWQRLAVLQHLPRYHEYLALGDDVCAALSFQDYYTIKFGIQPKDLDEDLLKDISSNLQENEFRKGILQTVSPVDDKTSIQNLERHSSSEVVVVHVDGMEAVPGTISNCEEITELAILQASDNTNNYGSNRDDLIGESDVNTLMASREECSLLVKEKQSFIRDEAEGIAQENVYILSQTKDDEHNDSSTIANLENLNVCLVETGESVKSPNGNKIQACEDLVYFLDTELKCKGMDASIILQCCASSTGDASNGDAYISECNYDPILASREADGPGEEQIAVKVQEKQFTKCTKGSSVQTTAIIYGGNSSDMLRVEDSSIDFIVNAEGGTLETEKCIPPYEDQASFSGETDSVRESNKKDSHRNYIQEIEQGREQVDPGLNTLGGLNLMSPFSTGMPNFQPSFLPVGSSIDPRVFREINPTILHSKPLYGVPEDKGGQSSNIKDEGALQSIVKGYSFLLSNLGEVSVSNPMRNSSSGPDFHQAVGNDSRSEIDQQNDIKSDSEVKKGITLEDPHTEDLSQEVTGFIFSKLLERNLELTSDLMEFRDYLLSSTVSDTLDVWELKDLGHQTAQRIVQASDPLHSMQEINQNFPNLVSSSSRMKINQSIKDEIITNQRMVPPGKSLIAINGDLINIESIDLFSLMGLVHGELSLADQIARLKVPRKDIKTLLYTPAPSEQGSFRLDFRSIHVHYLNNLEEDSMYRRWRSNLNELLMPVFPGQFHYIRKNLYHAVYVIDPSSAAGLKAVGPIMYMFGNHVPTRFGIILFSSKLAASIEENDGEIPAYFEEKHGNKFRKGEEDTSSLIISLFLYIEENYGTRMAIQILINLNNQWGLSKMDGWTKEEDAKLKEAVSLHGYCWAKVALFVPPRTDSQCR